MLTMSIRLSGFAAFAGCAVLLLAACGGGGGSKANASSTPSTNGAGDRSEFTSCLKDHGVTLPAGGFNPPAGGGANGGGPPDGGPPDGGVPGGNGNGGPQFSIPGVSSDKLQAAMSACRSKLPSGAGGFGGGANSQAFQAYTSCLRDHGVTVPTTTPGSTPTSGGAGGQLGALRNDPKFAEANKTCQALLPARNGSSTTVPS